MKKRYITPTIDVVEMRVQNQLLALSGDYVKSGNAGSGENLSRGHRGGWDDDDEY